ncbi:DUF4145 domain-containing protein [Nitrosopumilus sp. K4]|uniref:DUF4145 domain-containing protein n=1 Tax=Nitrosopumilus sp. K4 TaxID=2795383 RepID=UPI001BA540F0|nr:DUF4145 domain-containing protein [Nitrosopumilus sp. K4]QUC64395.1 DUF4145 domain-containing protein [Nitrosopumilus sp. K4]
MSKEQIDDLIWGKFESEIIDMKIPLHSSCHIPQTMAMDGAFALFNGFLTYLMLKLGYKPKLAKGYKGTLDDKSWWLNYLDEFDFMGLSYHSVDEDYSVPPFVFKQFFNESGKDITICLLLDWYSFYETNLALSKSKLDADSKYTHKLFYEFRNRNLTSYHVLDYMKDLQNEDFAKSHKLILRPDKLADFIIHLNEDYLDYQDFPNDVYTTEEWNKMSTIEQIGTYGKKELVFCNEDNFHHLLESASIQIPNVEFVTFSEFLQDKLIPEAQDWAEIRDAYIRRLKNSFVDTDDSKNFDRAKKFLRYAKNSLEKSSFRDSVINSSLAIEDTLSTFLNRSDLRLEEKIKELESNPDLGNHVINLHYIRNVRNRTVHASDFEVTEDIARHVLEMADQFLADIQK